MTSYVLPLEVAASGNDEIVSPELVLVDPALASVARARLPDPRPALRVVRHAPAVAARPVGVAWIPDELEQPERRSASPRVLVGVAAAAILSLLLFDVRVEVSERPASAELQPAVLDPVPEPMPIGPAAPGSSSGNAPRATERKFVWAPVPGATAYHVEFFSETTLVYSIGTVRPELTVPARWKYRGVERSFGPGEYRWYVWPVIDDRRESRAAIQTTISIPRTG